MTQYAYLIMHGLWKTKKKSVTNQAKSVIGKNMEVMYE